MIEFFRKNIEPNKKIRTLEIVVLTVLLLVAVISAVSGFGEVNENVDDAAYIGTIELTRNFDEEDYDEDSTVCDVIFENGDVYMILSYSYEEYEELDIETITAYQYETDNGIILCFDHEDVTSEEIQSTYKEVIANETMGQFNLANAFFILALSISIVLFFSQVFSTYEKCWFTSIMVLATIFCVLFPEESANGVSGIWIMLLYLLDTFLNILCELLISKQSRYNFLVSVAVEITEIAICLVLMYRFATMATTLFFWLPIDIISFINWSKHKDEEEDELTMVRSLKGYQEVLCILGIVLWTVVVGYFLSGLNIQSDFIQNPTVLTIVTYVDACASAVGVANGLFIFFRLKEQWIAWIICALLEMFINIISGQWVLLPLKLGYLTNSTYGFIKWNKYIKTHKEETPSLF